MTSGQETERVYSYNPGARMGQEGGWAGTVHSSAQNNRQSFASMATSDPASPAVCTGQASLNQHHKLVVHYQYHYQHLNTTCTSHHDIIMMIDLTESAEKKEQNKLTSNWYPVIQYPVLYKDMQL